MADIPSLEDVPELSDGSTDTSDSDVSTCTSSFSDARADTFFNPKSSDDSRASYQAQIIEERLRETEARLLMANNLRPIITAYIMGLFNRLASHTIIYQEHHQASLRPPGHRYSPAELRSRDLMIHHGRKRLELFSKIREALEKGSRLLASALRLLALKVELMGLGVDDDEVTEWMQDWISFRAQLGEFQGVLTEAIFDYP